MLITICFAISTALYRLATACYIVAGWHFRAAEKLYLADIDRRMRKGK
jgi:uncharacterized membrane protein YczE